MNNKEPRPRQVPEDAKNRAMRPRNAASLVVYRSAGKNVEALMGKRGQRARFKPGVYVFPGGTLDRADFRSSPSTIIDQDAASLMGVGNSLSLATALAMAAVRECYEETGLMLGSAGKVGQTGHPSWDVFQARGISPDLGKLAFLGRAITPTYHSLRYHARFFSVPYEEMEGSLGGDGELEDLCWVRVDCVGIVETTIIQTTMLNILHRRCQSLATPPQKLFYAWGRHNFVNL